MVWVVLNNLAWIAGLLIYTLVNQYNQPTDVGFSAMQKALDSLASIVPQVIRETRTGIYTNLYPRDTNGTHPVRSDTTNVRPDGQTPDPEENDDLIPAWETQEAYFGFPNLDDNQDQWISPTLPTE